MKNKYLFAVLLVFFFSGFNVLHAQFTDDMEYPTGIPSSSNWWDCSVGCPIIAGPNAGHNSDYAGYIPGDETTDYILNLGNKIFGSWGFQFWMLVPSNKGAYFNLQGSVPVTLGGSIVGNVFFNEDLNSPGQGSLDWGTSDPSDDTIFNFPHDQWFRITMLFDINAGMAFATWVMWIDDLPVVPYGTPLTDGNGTIPSSLGGVNYFSISMDNNYYLDDFQFSNGPLVIEENKTPRFSIYPNPTQDELNIVFEGEIEEVRLYDLNARLLVQGVSEKVVHVSRLSAGLYFIELLTTNGKSVQKFIKE